MTHQKSAGVVRHLGALALPFTVTIIVPALLIPSMTSLSPGWGLPFPLNLLPIILGVALIATGLTLVAITVSLFIRVGRGTLAPWDPTQRLVVVGIYRYVRNPMISGVSTILLGEAALFGSRPLLAWAILFMAVNAVYVPLLEEEGLRERFGVDYLEYTRHVPRWLPRRTPWVPSNSSARL